MRPEDQLRLISAYVDGEASDAEAEEVEHLLDTTPESRQTLDRLLFLRRELREAEEPAPDVSRAVLGTIAERRPAPLLARRLAVAFLAGILGGVVFVGLTPSPPAPIAAADVPNEVIAAQSMVTSFRAELQVTERGWHPEVPERTYTGRIAFISPESLLVEFQDRTAYPSADWVPNHSSHVIAEGTEWSRSVARCPTESLPSCTPAEPRLKANVNREPFAPASASALDVIVPVGGFVRAAEPSLVGFDRRVGHQAIGVRVTAAQLSGLIDGIIGRGNWREVHPTDRVELWLDVDTLVPLAFTIYPADTPDRALWAIRHGYTDNPDRPILEVEWRNVVVNGGEPSEMPVAPDAAPAVDAGFVDGTPADPAIMEEASVPDGLSPHRTGTIQVGSGPRVSVATWSDGRAWMKLEWTGQWAADRLFGSIGLPARRRAIGSGVGYVNEAGDRLALHGSEADVVLSGSLPVESLIDVAGSLDFVGLPVPPDWVEAASGTLEGAAETVDGLLVPGKLDGFAPPAVRIDAGSVSLSYSGAGDRAFVLTQSPGAPLPPPLEADVRGVEVRRLDGRYSPERGLLEWVERGTAFSIASTNLSVDELLAIAESLEPA